MHYHGIGRPVPPQGHTEVECTEGRDGNGEEDEYHVDAAFGPLLCDDPIPPHPSGIGGGFVRSHIKVSQHRHGQQTQCQRPHETFQSHLATRVGRLCLSIVHATKGQMSSFVNGVGNIKGGKEETGGQGTFQCVDYVLNGRWQGPSRNVNGQSHIFHHLTKGSPRKKISNGISVVQVMLAACFVNSLNDRDEGSDG